MDAKKLSEAIERLDVSLLGDNWRIIFDAAKAHLATLPKCQEIDVWHVEYSSPDGQPYVIVFRDYSVACRRALEIEARDYLIVRVTGPYKHAVPA